MKKFLLQIIILFILTAVCNLKAQGILGFLPLRMDVTEFPKDLKFEGKVKMAYTWNEGTEKHISFLTETGEYASEKFKHEEDGRDIELFAYHYLVKGDSCKLIWKVHDYSSDCPYDLEAIFIKNTFKLTDEDEDGVPEIWVMYKIACRSDVSPSSLKIIMYEGKQKYAMRGQTKVLEGTDDEGKKHYAGGQYTIDKAFTEGPTVFLEYAKILWKQNVFQQWGE